MLSHFIRHCSHTDTGKVVDGETSVARVVRREESVEAWPQEVIFQTCLKLGHPQSFREILK